MSMDNYAQNAEVVELSFVEKHCKEELSALVKFLEGTEEKLTLFDFQVDMSYNQYPECLLHKDTDKEVDELEKLWKSLQESFLQNTGLSLYCVYHNAEDRGDEIDGGYFAVDGVYGLTEAGKKFKNYITTKSWNVCE